MLELQQKLPNSRVVYSSATGATEPKNMAYMTRLGLWGKGTPFADFNAFIQVKFFYLKFYSIFSFLVIHVSFNTFISGR